MDAIEILGDLLGQKTQRPGAGADVLRDIFGRGSRQSSSPPPRKPDEIRQEAEKLEELLNVANKRSSDRRNGTAESLIAIDLDDRSEANYLNQLADGRRIPVEVRKQIHQRFGAPVNR